MCCLADGPTPSQSIFPTGRTLVFILCKIETGIKLMIAQLLEMGAHLWLPLPLCRTSVASFLEAVALSLDILIVVC